MRGVLLRLRQARQRRKRRGGRKHAFSWSRYFRKRHCEKYEDRFIQGLDYKEIDHPLYKYEMISTRTVRTSWVGDSILSEFFSLGVTGRLTIRIGYRWDGPSGPTVDTPSFMRSSAVHDCFFQIMREGKIPAGKRDDFFIIANNDLRRISRTDGMLRIRAAAVRFMVSRFGRKHTELVT